MLSFANLLLVSRFGWLMATLIGAALWGDLVLLPAMLAGTLGGWIARRIRPEDQDESMQLDDEDESSRAEAAVESGVPESIGSTPEPHLRSATRRDGKILRNDPGPEQG
jgi:hypothetical protein